MNKSKAALKSSSGNPDGDAEEEKEPLNLSVDSIGSKRGRPLI